MNPSDTYRFREEECIPLKLKVCGMKFSDNIQELSRLPIDMIGLIFYSGSPRFAGELHPEAIQSLSPSIKKVGVFVNESKKRILYYINKYNLQMIQLHGNESARVCQSLKSEAYSVIKTIPLENKNDLSTCGIFENSCDFFLFDTKTILQGGSGIKFNWDILSDYNRSTPFFLSGGISSGDASLIQSLRIQLPALYAIDINSRFETAPGEKNIHMIRHFIHHFLNT